MARSGQPGSARRPLRKNRADDSDCEYRSREGGRDHIVLQFSTTVVPPVTDLTEHGEHASPREEMKKRCHATTPTPTGFVGHAASQTPGARVRFRSTVEDDKIRTASRFVSESMRTKSPRSVAARSPPIRLTTRRSPIG